MSILSTVDYSKQEPTLSEEELKLKAKVRFWERDYEKWQEGRAPKPGPHPVADHQWNTHPEIFDMSISMRPMKTLETE